MRPRLSGSILAVERQLEGAAADAFTVDGELPAGKTLHGSWMIVTQADGSQQGHEAGRRAVERQSVILYFVSQRIERTERQPWKTTCLLA